MDVRAKLVELFYENNVRCDQKIEGLADDVIDIIDHGVTVQEWIPVTERLPGNDDFVLVIVSGKAGNITLDNAAELASFSMDEGWILEMWPEWEDPNVTYWMPLPEQPKGE